MGFAAGFAAGSAAVDRGLDMAARGKRMKRQEEEDQRQQAARDSYHQLQQDYYGNQGEFAPAGAPADPQAAATANASYDRLETQRMGLQPQVPDQAPMADSQGQMQPRGLSMTPQQTQGAAPQPLDATTKDKLYYTKLSQWADTHLDPDKAMAYKNELVKMEETGYQQRRLTAFRQLSNGDRQGLENAFQLGQANGMIPKGAKFDLSQAVFDPEKGWAGVQVSNPKTGETQNLDLDHNRMIGMFMSSDPAQMLQYKVTMAKEKRADKAETRADRGMTLQENADKRSEKKLGLEVNADKRADRLADSTIATNAAQIRQGDARIGIAKGQLDLAGKHLDLDRQKLDLEKQVRAGDEKAKDVLTRQNQYLSTYGFSGKLDPMSPTYAQDQARAEAGKQLAGLATSIYSISAEGAKPGERNAIAAETDTFIRQFDSGSLDKSKLKDNGDGTMSYGRVKVPSALFDSRQEEAPAKGLKGPTAAKGVQVPGRPLYNEKTSALERMASKPKGISSEQATQAQDELQRRQGEARMGAF